MGNFKSLQEQFSLSWLVASGCISGTNQALDLSAILFFRRKKMILKGTKGVSPFLFGGPREDLVALEPSPFFMKEGERISKAELVRVSLIYEDIYISLRE